MQHHSRWVWMAVSLSMGASGWYSPAWGQIVPDETLPVNSRSALNNNTFQIDGGTEAGTNLFHSFRDFSVPTGSEAFFNNALTVENIITRVTGSNISHIDGLIRANGTANLFLLNPNGIVFGANARLDLGGSFLASSADRLQFAEGSVFSASDTAATPPLLTVSVPIGLQFGGQPGGIRVEGSGHNLLDGVGVDFSRDFRTVGLQVGSEQTLALVGGSIDLVGGNLTAVGDVSSAGEKISSGISPGGRIELGSVGGNSTVQLLEPTVEGLEGWMLNFDDVREFQDIHLSAASSLDVSGSRVGTIQVRGRSISVRDGSAMLALTLGSESALSGVPSIWLNAQEAVEVSGKTMLVDPRGPSVETKRGISSIRMLTFYSRLLTRGGLTEGSELSGRGGNMTIDTARLRVNDGAFVATETNKSGDAGNLTINATQSVELSNGNLFATSLSPSRADFNAGQGGNISIDTARLRLDNDAEISVSTYSNGDSGQLTIHARESIHLSQQSAIRAASVPPYSRDEKGLNRGQGGNIAVTTPYLGVFSGSNIATTTVSRGNAGDLQINADRIELSGVQVDKQGNPIPDRPSRLESQVNTAATANGGTLTVNTDRLSIENGARISVATNSERGGHAGTLNIHARDVVELRGERSSLVAGSCLDGNCSKVNGNGGNVNLTTPRLLVANGARIATTTRSSGSAGDVTINARDMTVTGVSSHPTLGLQPSRVEAQVAATRDNGNPTGNGGSITVNVDRLLLENGGKISASTQGAGDAGSVNIIANELEVRGFASLARFPDEPSRIEAVADSTPNNPTPAGDAGSVNIEANSVEITDGAGIVVLSEGTGKTGDLAINSSHIQLRNGSEINAEAQSPFNEGGNITIETDTLTAVEDSDITANSQGGGGGNITINAEGIFGTEVRDGFFDTPQSDITATGRVFNGTIEIPTPDVDPRTGLLQLPETPIDATSTIGHTPCAQGVGSEFVDRGRGGLPPIPSEALPGEWTSVGLIDFPPNGQSRTREDLEIQSPETVAQPRVRALVEAQGWFVDVWGRAILTTQPSTLTFEGEQSLRTSCRVPLRRSTH